jgi:hypothetical protein
VVDRSKARDQDELMVQVAAGMKQGGPDPNHLREGENTQGLLNRVCQEYLNKADSH